MSEYMIFLEIFIQVNLTIILPIIIFGLLFHKLGEISNKNVFQAFGWKGYAIFSCLGTAIHEVSHYIFCKLFFYEITDVALFRPIKGRDDGKLGYVLFRYNPRSLYQRIGNFFVGIAPMIGGGLVLLLLFQILLPETYVALAHLQNYTLDCFIDALKTIHSIPLFLVYLFFSITISMHMSISSADLQSAKSGILWVELALLAFSVCIPFSGVSIFNSIQTASSLLILIFLIGLISSLVTCVITDVIAK